MSDLDLGLDEIIRRNGGGSFRGNNSFGGSRRRGRFMGGGRRWSPVLSRKIQGGIPLAESNDSWRSSRRFNHNNNNSSSNNNHWKHDLYNSGGGGDGDVRNRDNNNRSSTTTVKSFIRGTPVINRRLESPSMRSTRPSTRRSRSPLLQDQFRTNPQHLRQVIIVSNLEQSVTERDLIDLFKEFGLIGPIRMDYDAMGRSTGTARITYENRRDAIQAMTEYHGLHLDGRPLNIRLEHTTNIPFIRNAGLPQYDLNDRRCDDFDLRYRSAPIISIRNNDDDDNRRKRYNDNNNFHFRRERFTAPYGRPGNRGNNPRFNRRR